MKWWDHDGSGDVHPLAAAFVLLVLAVWIYWIVSLLDWLIDAIF